MSVTVDYISGGINPKCGNASWGPEWLAFGVGRSVALARVANQSAHIEQMLFGHAAAVNAVSWITGTALLSASADRTVRLWRHEDGAFCDTVLKGHAGPVTGVSGIEENADVIVVSCGADGQVRFWHLSADAVVKEQSLKCPQNGLCLCVKLTRLPDSCLLLLCALSNCRIRCYGRAQPAGDLAPLIDLPGHADWVRSIDCFRTAEADRLWIASAAQDRSVRLWAVEKAPEEEVDDVLRPRQLRLCSEASTVFTVRVEAVLMGHEEAVTGAAWFECDGVLRLLTCGKDKAVVVWSKDSSGLWTEDLRVGEVGGGGLGFLGCCVSPSSDLLLAYGLKGGLSLWRRDAASASVTVGLTGHVGRVADVAWSPDGVFLLSAGGSDQTVRIHAPWQREWHEVARPQIHGYDLAAVAPLGPRSYACGAEEKTVRLFDAPRSFSRGLAHLQGGGAAGDEAEAEVEEAVMAPALGLSNKAGRGSAKLWDFPPPEDALSGGSLWPEARKLFGLGREVFALDARGEVVAAAASAKNVEEAAVLVWRRDGGAAQQLEGHKLTVTELRFAPGHEARLLLSVSRDRSWRLWRREAEDFGLWRESPRSGGHGRVIWAAAWAPSGRHFFTASRDKTIRAWSAQEEDTTQPQGTSFVAEDAVTALDAAPQLLPRGDVLLGAGLENGALLLLAWGHDGFRELLRPNPSQSSRVTKLRFRPGLPQERPQVASSGEDHLVLLHNFDLTDLT